MVLVFAVNRETGRYIPHKASGHSIRRTASRRRSCSISVREMKLVPREVEKIALHNAGFLAQKRLARGLRLNYTEAVALIATQILEFVRDGDKKVSDLMDLGKQLLGRRQVLPAVRHLLDTVQVEATFPDGTKLVTIHDPIASDNGNLELALHGSFLPGRALQDYHLLKQMNKLETCTT